MPRKPRQESKNGIYHVTNRGLERKAIFGQSRERTRMENLIRENREKYQVEIYAYCIMPNHFHLLLKAELNALASFMAVISAKYAFYYNYKHNRNGMVFQNRFRSQCVEDDNYFWNCVRYIHMNPIKANLCRTAVEYRHSSMKEYCTFVRKEKRIIAENSKEWIKSRFAGIDDFYEFHWRNCRDFFIDIPDEEMDQRIRITKELLAEYARNIDIPIEEVLEYAKFRADFEKEVTDYFGISKIMVKNIRDKIRNELKEK